MHASVCMVKSCGKRERELADACDGVNGDANEGRSLMSEGSKGKHRNIHLLASPTTLSLACVFVCVRLLCSLPLLSTSRLLFAVSLVFMCVHVAAILVASSGVQPHTTSRPSLTHKHFRSPPPLLTLSLTLRVAAEESACANKSERSRNMQSKRRTKDGD